MDFGVLGRCVSLKVKFMFLKIENEILASIYRHE